LAEELYTIDNNLNGINTEAEIAKKFSEFYCMLSNKKFKEKMKLRILVLTKMKEGKLKKNLTFRKAELKDKNILKKYIYEMTYEIFNKKKDDEEIEILFQKAMKSGFYIIEDNGKIVSQVAINSNLINGKSLGYVFTPKDERNRGYCYNLMYRLCEELLKNEENKFICLYTDDTNPISNHIYEKIGFERKMNCIEIGQLILTLLINYYNY
jgi:predicted GNAT family acetyltransferase